MTNEKENTILIIKVKNYIQQNINKKLPLEELAKEANYSTFHFQRIFKSVVGETPKQYIKRVRLENASHFITLKPSISILEVAFEFGFTSLESFSRAFKNYYKVSPDGFRKSTEEQKTVIIQAKINKTLDINLYLSKSITKITEDMVIEIVKLPAKKSLYISTTLKSPETVTESYRKIKQWTEVRDLTTSNTELFGLLHDYPLYTSLDKCRFYTCISVDAKPKVRGEINYVEIPSRTYISFKLKGGITILIQSITKLNKHWLPESGYEFAHFPAVLIPLDDPLTNHQHDINYQVFIAITPK